MQMDILICCKLPSARNPAMRAPLLLWLLLLPPAGLLLTAGIMYTDRFPTKYRMQTLHDVHATKESTVVVLSSPA